MTPLTANAKQSEQPAMRADWVDRIFMRLTGRFGNTFTNRYASGQLMTVRQCDINGSLADMQVDMGILAAKTVWAQELADFTKHDIKRGLEARYSYAPSCDDFIKAARLVDYEALFCEASKGHMARRNNDDKFIWSNPVSFWAGVEFGVYDLLNGQYDRVKMRWQSCVDRISRQGCSHVPDLAKQLSAPEFKKNSEVAKKAMGAMKNILGKVNGRQYWTNLINSEGFEQLPLITKQMAAEGLRNLGCAVPENAVPYLKKREAAA